MRESDRSPKWDQETLRCRKCLNDKPPYAFIVRRKTSDMLGETCQDCRAPRSTLDKIRASANGQRERAKRLGVANTLTASQWVEKLERSGGYCYLCHSYVGIDALTIDHRIALDKGGGNTIENVEPACWNCNLRKYKH